MRVAAVQLNSTADSAANLATADRLTRAAAADGARLIVLPEKWTAIGSDEELQAAAETLEEFDPKMQKALLQGLASAEVFHPEVLPVAVYALGVVALGLIDDTLGEPRAERAVARGWRRNRVTPPMPSRMNPARSSSSRLRLASLQMNFRPNSPFTNQVATPSKRPKPAT